MAIGPISLAAGQRQGNLWGAEATQTASWGLLPRHITGHPKVVFISLMWPQTRGQGSQLGIATLALRNELSSHSSVSTALLRSYNKWTMTLAQVTSESSAGNPEYFNTCLLPDKSVTTHCSLTPSTTDIHGIQAKYTWTPRPLSVSMSSYIYFFSHTNLVLAHT